MASNFPSNLGCQEWAGSGSGRFFLVYRLGCILQPHNESEDTVYRYMDYYMHAAYTYLYVLAPIGQS